MHKLLARNGTEFSGGPVSGPMNFATETWHCVEYKVALNTPYTSSNGSVSISKSPAGSSTK